MFTCSAFFPTLNCLTSSNSIKFGIYSNIVLINHCNGGTKGGLWERKGLRFGLGHTWCWLLTVRRRRRFGAIRSRFGAIRPLRLLHPPEHIPRQLHKKVDTNTWYLIRTRVRSNILQAHWLSSASRSLLLCPSANHCTAAAPDLSK